MSAQAMPGTHFKPTDRILVAGGTGFIGRHLAQRCLTDTPRVTCLSARGPDVTSPLGLVVRQGDLTDPQAVRRALEGGEFDYVFNLGGYIDHRRYADGGRRVIDAHFAGLMNLIDALNWPTLKGFVQTGSSEEYGEAQAPQREDQQGRAISPYAFAKQSATKLVQTLNEREGFPGVVVRLFLVYGPGQDGKRFLPQIVTACLKGERFAVSPGEQLRDFCYVGDIVEGMVRAALSERARGEIINLASGVPARLRDVIEKVVALLGRGTPLFGERPYRTGESMALVADVSKARALLHWEPAVDLATGLLRTVDDFEAQLAACKS